MPHRCLGSHVRSNNHTCHGQMSLPFGSRCCVLGTVGRLMAHSSLPVAACSLLSLVIFLLPNRDSAPGRFWLVPSFDPGVPTVFTEALGTFAGPSLEESEVSKTIAVVGVTAKRRRRLLTKGVIWTVQGSESKPLGVSKTLSFPKATRR